MRVNSANALAPASAPKAGDDLSGQLRKRSVLLTDSELADYFAITIRIVLFQIIQKAASLADKHEQTASRAMVLLVGLEVLGQLPDTLAQDSNLNFGAAGIGIVSPELRNDLVLFLGCQHGLAELLLLCSIGIVCTKDSIAEMPRQ